MTAKVMDKTLKKYEVKEFNPLGEKFDPNTCEGVCNMPSE